MEEAQSNGSKELPAWLVENRDFRKFLKEAEKVRGYGEMNYHLYDLALSDLQYDLYISTFFHLGFSTTEWCSCIEH